MVVRLNKIDLMVIEVHIKSFIAHLSTKTNYALLYRDEQVSIQKRKR